MSSSSPTLQARERRIVTPPAQKEQATGPQPGGVRILRSGQEAVELPLLTAEQYVLGRHDAADVGFEDESVSRLHGVLRHTGEGWVLTDYGSKNGTLLFQRNGEPRSVVPHRAVSIFVGDVIELGSDASRLELIERVDPPPTAGPDPTRRSAAARAFEDKVAIAARTKVPVFLLGPSGCGKTHTARQIHDRSASSGAFVPINCARLPADPSALHSELLGHVKGAFTGAEGPRTGKLLHADGGTLFLDEVESLSPLAQGFLLDVLEGTGDLAPLGAGAPKLSAPIFRLISASKSQLSECGLRDDLCERLAEGHMWRVPTLEERTDDIPGLVARFAMEQSSALGLDVEVADAAVRAARAAAWPGQIRQLRATVRVLAQMAVARMPSGDPLPKTITLTKRELDQHLRERAEAFGALGFQSIEIGDEPLRQKADARALTREHVTAILRACDGNQSEAARRLGIARNTLARKIKEFQL